MTVTTIDKDTEALTLTLTADFAAPVDAVWELWADPRKLERWWGPPSYPATFVEHDLTPGALVTYFMTSPDGDKHYGWWRIGTVDAPSVSRLAEAYPMSFAAVQKHVAVLERAGLVAKERRGRETLVRTEAAAVARARRALDELEDLWRGRVDRMSEVLSEEGNAQ